MKSQSQVTEWATHVLRNIGPAAIPELKAALKSAEGTGRERVEGLLAVLQPASDERFAKLVPINRELLEVFVAVAEIFIERGRASWREIAGVVQERVTAGTYSAEALEAAAANTLSKKMKELSSALGMQLTDHQPRRKGSLTNEARALVPDVQDFLLIYG